MILWWNVTLWIKHKPHILGFKVFYHLVTKFLLSISNYSPVYACLGLGSYHHSPTTEYLEFCSTQFSKFLTLWLERSPMWTLSWQYKINSIAFYTSKLSNCLKDTWWQCIRINWNLGRSGKERGSKRRMRVCVYIIPPKTTELCWAFCQSNFTLVTKVLQCKNNLFYKLAVKSLEKPTMNNLLLVIFPLLSLFNP